MNMSCVQASLQRKQSLLPSVLPPRFSLEVKGHVPLGQSSSSTSRGSLEFHFTKIGLIDTRGVQFTPCPLSLFLTSGFSLKPFRKEKKTTLLFFTAIESLSPLFPFFFCSTNKQTNIAHLFSPIPLSHGIICFQNSWKD